MILSHLPADHWPSPAKLNLFLHITGQRADGYHQLQTLFQFLDYGDVLHFQLREDGRIQRRQPLPGVSIEHDLCVRAACLLQQETKAVQGVDITLDKHLPMGGGLGGGSSNAATTLVALNHLWGCGLNRDELMALGLRLGADVPVFINGVAAWAEGIGEQLTPAEPPQPWFLVIKPPVEVSTAKIFGALELTRNCPPITICDFVSGGAGNVCEPVVTQRYPEVGQALAWLGTFSTARLTGTGSCIFAPFEDREQAEQVFASRPEAYQGFIARALNRSPLIGKRPPVSSAAAN